MAIEVGTRVRFIHWIDGAKISEDVEMAGAEGVVLDLLPSLNYRTAYNVDFGDLNIDEEYIICYDDEIEEITNA
jgi:hypothetical protein